jgi:hypothetical protein
MPPAIRTPKDTHAGVSFLSPTHVIFGDDHRTSFFVDASVLPVRIKQLITFKTGESNPKNTVSGMNIYANDDLSRILAGVSVVTGISKRKLGKSEHKDNKHEYKLLNCDMTRLFIQEWDDIEKLVQEAPSFTLTRPSSRERLDGCLGFAGSYLMYGHGEHFNPRPGPAIEKVPHPVDGNLELRYADELFKGTEISSCAWICLLPNDEYAVNYQGLLYRLDQNTGKFDTTPLQIMTEQNTEIPIIDQPDIMITTETGRFFYVKNNCMYELTWQNERLSLLRTAHLPWLTGISSLRPMGKHRLFVERSVHPKDAITINNITASRFVYDLEKNTLTTHERLANGFALWNENLKCFILLHKTIAYNNIPREVEHSDTITEADIQDAAERGLQVDIASMYDQEKMAYNLSFKAYSVPEGIEMKALHKLDLHSMNERNVRISVAYHPASDINHYSIIAGFNCKDNEKTSPYIDPNYQELESWEELGDYLGAPIFWDNKDQKPAKKRKKGEAVKMNKACMTDYLGEKRSDSMHILCTLGMGNGSFYLSKEQISWFAIVVPRNEPLVLTTEEKPRKKRNVTKKHKLGDIS